MNFKKIVFSIALFLSFILSVESCKHYPPDIIPDINDTTGKDTTKIPKRPCSSDTVYYARDIQPLFNTYCVGSGCHNPPKPEENLDLTSYSTAMASGKIKPYNSSNSDVYKAMNGTGGDIMPPSGKLSPDKIALVKKWIDQGAKDLWCDEMVGPCDTTNVTYSGTISKIMTNNCVGCHGTSGNVTLSNYTGAKNAVNGKLWDAINHFPGAVPMPSSTTKLSACNIRQIKIWMDADAPNN